MVRFAWVEGCISKACHHQVLDNFHALVEYRIRTSSSRYCLQLGPPFDQMVGKSFRATFEAGTSSKQPSETTAAESSARINKAMGRKPNIASGSRSHCCLQDGIYRYTSTGILARSPQQLVLLYVCNYENTANVEVGGCTGVKE